MSAVYTNTHMTNKKKLSPAARWVAGIVALGVGIFLFVYATGIISAVPGWSRINATISNLDTSTRRTFVDYIYNSTPYSNVLLNAFEDGWKIGASIIIFVDPNNPTNIKWVNLPPTFLLITMGIVFSLVGIFLLFQQIKTAVSSKRAKNQSLEANATIGSEINIDASIINENGTQNADFKMFIGTQMNKNKISLEIRDESGRKVYTINKTSFNLFKGYQAEFKNVLTNNIVNHQIGNSLGCTANGFTSPTDFFFFFDGNNVWDVFTRLGVTIESEGHIIKGKYKNNLIFIAYSSYDPSSKGFKIGRYELFKKRQVVIKCDEKNLDIASLAGFACYYITSFTTANK